MKIAKFFMVKLLEIMRNSFAIFGFYLAYVYYAEAQYNSALLMLIVFVVIPLTGLTAIESIFFSNMAAKAKGREIGSPYQIQSGLNNLAVAITALIVWLFNWGVYANLTVLFVALIFFALSSINHAVEFFRQGNKKIVHLMRPILSLLLVLAALPIISKTL
jgi:hypothetical protein